MSLSPGRSGRGRLGRVMVTLAAVGAVGLAACGNDPVEPEVEFQVIEKTEFADSLNVDLSAMTKLPEGVYIQDLVAGTGPGLTAGGHAWVYYQLRLSDGSPVDFNGFHYTAPLGGIDGWDIGMEGMMPGGTRVMLIPPELAYGAVGRPPVPPGAILHFRVELDSIT